jgi:hypothetical protein
MKIKIPVYITATASKRVGFIEVDSEDSEPDINSLAEELWENEDWDVISVNISNDFDIGESDIDYKDLLWHYEEGLKRITEEDGK